MSPVAWTGKRILVDPSFLCSGHGLEWLEGDAELRAVAVAPQTFIELLRNTDDFEVRSLLHPEDAELFSDRRARIEAVLGEIRGFSHREVVVSPRSVEEVRLALVLERTALGDLHADEWAFLQTHSVMFSKLRRPLDAFRDAGAVIVEFGRKAGARLLEQVIPKEHLPPAVTKKLIATAAVKWIVLGGAGVGGGTLGAVAGTSIGGPIGGLIGSKAIGLAAGSATRAAVLAVDP
jgi:hypothetical protein